MGYFDETLATIARHKERMQDESVTVEEAISTLEELKVLRRNICRNPHTRRSILQVRVNSAMNAARHRISTTKAALVQEFAKSNAALDTYYHIHPWVVVTALIIFYLFVLSTQAHVSHRG